MQHTPYLKIKIFLITMAVCVLASSRGHTQSYPFKQFPLPQDLPRIMCMQEDHDGYMWLGTLEGLFRFDGINYTYFQGKNGSAGLGREFISCIFEDQHDMLWIGARTGLYRYKNEDKDFEKFSFSDELYPYYIHQENDSCMLVHSLLGIYLFYPEHNRWDKLDVGIEDNKIFTVIKGRNDDVWIGTDNVVIKYNLRNKTIANYKLIVPGFNKNKYTISAHNLFLDGQDQLWINTWFKGVVKLDTKTGASISFGPQNINSKNYLLEYFNPSITEDIEGNIWLASDDTGINIYHPDNENITHVVKGFDYGSGLMGNHFLIHSDAAGNIWVRSDKAIHFLAQKSPVPILKSDVRMYIDDPLFIHFITPGYALVGTYFGLYGINLKTHQVSNFNSAIRLPTIHDAEKLTISDIIIDKDILWLTSPQGLRKVQYTINTNGDPVLQFKNLYTTQPELKPSMLITVNDSTIFVKGRSNTNVFATFQPSSGSYHYHQLPDSMLINQGAAFRNDTILLGIRNKGLFYYDVMNDKLSLIPWNLENSKLKIQKPVFYDIVPFTNGDYGVCTENHGLFIYHPAKKSFRHVDVATLARTNIVYGVEEDLNHNLWIQTKNQLLFYNSTTESLSKVNLSNSFRGSNPPYFLHDGHQLYTTFEGQLYEIDIEQLFTKTEKPKLYLQDIKADDRSLDWTNADKIRLPSSNNFLSYEFVGLDYDNPRGIRYWYKIPEISDQWVFLDNRTSISIGRLASGKYNFSLKASNDAGIWSEEIHAPEIIITPPFWRTSWFILAIATVCGALILYLFRLRKLKTESELRLRNQIARDLHDDIGSTLSGIKIMSGLASDMAEKNNDLSALLHQVRDKSDLMMQSMGDIVWSINPAHDSINDMVIRLKQYMSEVLESQNIDVQFISHIDLKSHKIDLSHRKELYLTLKEIINNIAKHAACHQVIFEVSRQSSKILFAIKDDGLGMDEKRIVVGNGLGNIETRIKQMNGHLKRVSSPGQGTSYEISVGIQ